MVPPEVIPAKLLEKGDKFIVLDSSKTSFFSTVYTFTHLDKEKDIAHCTYKTKQAGKKYTEPTWFGSETKVKKVLGKKKEKHG
jgi:hypothetical protein